MTEATDKLAASRRAILEHIARRTRRHDPREETAQGFAGGYAYEDAEPPPDPGGDWFGHFEQALKTWWHYHPAHMAVDLATPLLRSYARRKPMQLLGISLAAGAALTFARPWRLISLTTLLVALMKSSQLSSVFLAAMSAADYRKDQDRPG